MASIFPYIPPDPQEQALRVLQVQAERERILDFQEQRRQRELQQEKLARDLQQKQAFEQDVSRIESDPQYQDNIDRFVQAAKAGTLAKEPAVNTTTAMPNIQMPAMPDRKASLLLDMKRTEAMRTAALKNGQITTARELGTDMRNMRNDYEKIQADDFKQYKQDLTEAGNVAVDAQTKLRADPSLWPAYQARIAALLQRVGLPSNIIDGPAYTKQVDAFLGNLGAQASKQGQLLDEQSKQQLEVRRQLDRMDLEKERQINRIQITSVREQASLARDQRRADAKAAHDLRWPKPTEKDYVSTQAYLMQHHPELRREDGSALSKEDYMVMSRAIVDEAHHNYNQDPNGEMLQDEAIDGATEDYFQRHTQEHSEVTKPSWFGIPTGDPTLTTKKIWHPEAGRHALPAQRRELLPSPVAGHPAAHVTDRTPAPGAEPVHPYTLKFPAGQQPTRDQEALVAKYTALIDSGKATPAEVQELLRRKGLNVDVVAQ